MKTNAFALIYTATGQIRSRVASSAGQTPNYAANPQPGAWYDWRRDRCRQNSPCQAFTRIELVAAIIVSCLLVAALFLPAFPASKARSRTAVCLNNLREIDLGLSQYAADFQHFLNSREWGAIALNSASARFELYLPQNPEALVCPNKRYSVPTASRPEGLVAFERLSYGYNGAGTAPDGRELELGMGLWRHIATSRVKVPSDMLVLGDSGVGIQSSVVLSPYEISSLRESAMPDQPQLPAARHDGGANILFCDGHAAFGKQSKWIERTPEARRQWNNDNQPHHETW